MANKRSSNRLETQRFDNTHTWHCNSNKLSFKPTHQLTTQQIGINPARLLAPTMRWLQRKYMSFGSLANCLIQSCNRDISQKGSYLPDTVSKHWPWHICKGIKRTWVTWKVCLPGNPVVGIGFTGGTNVPGGTQDSKCQTEALAGGFSLHFCIWTVSSLFATNTLLVN